MRYNVKDLATISKTSVRTLHHYDQIGILTPSIRMANGRRYYDTKELFLLHEILFFKETGFSLKKIKSIMQSSSSTRSSLLHSQKKTLLKKISRLRKVCEPIDHIIADYKGKQIAAQELQQPFIKKDPNQIEELAKNTVPVEIKKLAEQAIQLNKKLVSTVESHIQPDSPEAQALIQENLDFSRLYSSLTIKEFVASRSHLKSDSPLCQYYRQLHPKLPEFLYEAMGIFGNNHFTE